MKTFASSSRMAVPTKAAFARQGNLLVAPKARSARPVARRSPAAALSATAERDAVGSSAALNLDTVPVTFKVLLKVNFGEGLRVVGSSDVLGGWEVDRAPQMAWTEGHVWTATVDLPAGQDVEFKFVHYMPNKAPIWECTQNRTFTPSATAAVVDTQWNNPMAQFEAKAITMQPEVLELLETPYFSTVLTPTDPSEAAPAEEIAPPAARLPAATALAAEPAAEPRFELGANYDADIESMFSMDISSSLEDVVAALVPKLALAVQPKATTTAAAADVALAPEAVVAEAAPAEAAAPSSASLLKTMGKTAGFVAMGVAAGALMSALAVDVVDVAMMGAVMAAAGSAAMSNTKSGASSDEEGEAGEEGESRRSRPKGSEPGVIMAAAMLSAMDVGKSVLVSASETLEAASVKAEREEEEKVE